MSFTKSILRFAGGGSMATSAPAVFAPGQASRPTRRSCAGARTEGLIRLQEAQSIVTHFRMACPFGRLAPFLNESFRRRQTSAHSRLNRSKIARRPAPNKNLEAVSLVQTQYRYPCPTGLAFESEVGQKVALET